jgi:3-hydroxy-9,10-secoandrosta-1,3,5(10)-triene-9,17-dione monooxygenase
VGSVARTSPIQLDALACAAADIEASVSHFRALVAGHHEQAEGGVEISLEQRLGFRRDQVRATSRCITAVDTLFRSAGSGSMVTGHPVERAWRDLHIAASHVCNTTELTYQAWGQHRFGGAIPAGATF